MIILLNFFLSGIVKNLLSTLSNTNSENDKLSILFTTGMKGGILQTESVAVLKHNKMSDNELIYLQLKIIFTTATLNQSRKKKSFTDYLRLQNEKAVLGCYIYLAVCRHSALLPRFALGSIRSSLHRHDEWGAIQ